MNQLSFLLFVMFAAAEVLGSRNGSPNVLQEFCQLETFQPQCWKNEVIIIQEATYGRHRVGKCITADEAAFSQDVKYFGCWTDVKTQLDGKCSGRKQCEVRIPDADLERTRTCLTGMHMFLEVSYRCVEVVDEDRSCAVSLTTSSPLHIATSSSRQSNINCGTKTQPWLLEAPAGQRINISLLDFTPSQQLAGHSTSLTSTSTSSSSSVSCEHQYGYIIDKSSVNRKNVSVCGSVGSNRQQHVYLSFSKQLQIVLNIEDQPNANFLLKVEAVGCTDLIPPEDSWLKREDDKITIGCYTSRQTWQLRCVDGRWTGVVSNCTKIHFTDLNDDVKTSQLVRNKPSDSLARHQVIAIVAVSFVGLAVCLTIICCGFVCLRRFYAQNSPSGVNSLEKKPGVKYNYIQSDDVRMSTGQQQQLRMTSQPAAVNQPQYSVYVSNNADVNIGSHVITTARGQYFVLDPDAVN